MSGDHPAVLDILARVPQDILALQGGVAARALEGSIATHLLQRSIVTRLLQGSEVTQGTFWLVFYSTLFLEVVCLTFVLILGQVGFT